jgi:hypothetical protein
MDPPLCSREQMDWKYQISSVENKFKIKQSAGEMMLTFLWVAQGPILKHYQEWGSITVNSVSYNEMLPDQLKPVI